jgi:hypothetical protein
MSATLDLREDVAKSHDTHHGINQWPCPDFHQDDDRLHQTNHSIWHQGEFLRIKGDLAC